MDRINSSVTLSIPGSVRAAAPSHTEAPQAEDVFLHSDVNAEHDWRLLQAALKEAEAAEQREYYDPVADAAEARRYYSTIADAINRISPQEAFRRFTDILTKTHKTKLKYDPAVHLYPWVDRNPDLKLHGIYDGDVLDPRAAILKDFRLFMTEDDDPEHQPPYNCEHVVPQKWFDRREPMRGDLHHLFASAVDCNSLRGSLPYFEGDEGSPPPKCGYVPPSLDRFEPMNGKGEVARATLYFLMRYPGLIGDERGEVLSGFVGTLLAWHRDDPVTDYERHRNAEIFKKQGNRNPLIDHPEWASRIDFTMGVGRYGKRAR